MNNKVRRSWIAAGRPQDQQKCTREKMAVQSAVKIAKVDWMELEPLVRRVLLFGFSFPETGSRQEPVRLKRAISNASLKPVPDSNWVENRGSFQSTRFRLDTSNHPNSEILSSLRFAFIFPFFTVDFSTMPWRHPFEGFATVMNSVQFSSVQFKIDHCYILKSAMDEGTSTKFDGAHSPIIGYPESIFYGAFAWSYTNPDGFLYWDEWVFRILVREWPYSATFRDEPLFFYHYRYRQPSNVFSGSATVSCYR